MNVARVFFFLGSYPMFVVKQVITLEMSSLIAVWEQTEKKKVVFWQDKTFETKIKVWKKRENTNSKSNYMKRDVLLELRPTCLGQGLFKHK